MNWLNNAIAAFKTLQWVKTFSEWFNTDTRDAVLVILGVILLAFILISVSGCAVSEPYRPRLEAGLAYELDSGKPVVGRDPVGVARVIQPLWVHKSGFNVIGEYLHLSSIPDVDDSNTVDQVGVLFSVPLGRRATALEPRCIP